MKTSRFTITLPALILAAAFFTNFSHAQTTGSSVPVSNVSRPALPAPTPYTVVSRDANSAIWQRTTYELSPSGQVVPRTHRYTELATGLNFWSNGQWTPSREEIDLLPDGMVAATNGQHQVYFPSDVAQGVIALTTPDGLKLQSQPIALSYNDGSNTVLIAELTNSTGAILPSGNQAIYQNAFTGIAADLLYTYTKAGFEQDIILREQPPDPASFGLNPQTTRLQVLTEFFNPPQPSVRATTVPTAAGNVADDSLGFGTMQMGQGKAFLLGTNSPSVAVNKQWLVLAGRQFLIEEVPIVSIAKQIDTLPLFATKTGLGTKAVVSRNPVPPPRPLSRTPSKALFLAQALPPSRGLVLDYQTINSSQTNYTFQGDTTYYISSSVYLYGTNTFEGGTVIKYANTNSPGINVYGPINCLTGSYRPAVFTAKDDNTVGETISGSSGNPIGTYASGALSVVGYSANLGNMRFAYANEALAAANCEVGIKDSQFINDANPIFAIHGGVNLENVLIYGVSGTVFGGYDAYSFTAQNITIHDANVLCDWGYVIATNSLLICVNNLAGLSESSMNNYANSSDASIFQTVGAGSHYLAATSPSYIRNGGTTNIDPTLLASL